MIIINSTKQTLSYKDKIYAVSTSKFGLGEEKHSHKTPRGRHKIYQKIGENNALYTIFKARKKIGVWEQNSSKEDLILSRILWLEGIDPHNANSKERYIYIHGTNEEYLLGTPASIGCIRMGNNNIIELFNQVKCGDIITII